MSLCSCVCLPPLAPAFLLSHFLHNLWAHRDYFCILFRMMEESREHEDFSGTPDNPAKKIKLSEPTFLFKRRATRMREENKQALLPPTAPEIEQSIQALERGAWCDCHIKVKEGLIPVHGILVCNARTIGSAFASAMAEGRSMVYDMSAWRTGPVLDIIELLYTQSLTHIKPLHTQHVFWIFELLVYLEHPLAHKFLMRVMVSALITLDAINDRFQYGTKLDPVILQNNMGKFYTNEGVLATEIWIVLFQVLWIVTELKDGVPPMDKGEVDTLIELFCRTFLRVGQSLELDARCAAYFFSFSLNTLTLLVKKCVTACMEYNWEAIFKLINFWISFDLENRLDGLELFKLFSEHIPLESAKRIAQDPYVLRIEKEQKFIENVWNFVQIAKNTDTAHLLSPMTPFTFINNPSENPAPPKLKSDNPFSPHTKAYLFGMEMFMKWLVTTSAYNSHPKTHKCTKYP